MLHFLVHTYLSRYVGRHDTKVVDISVSCRVKTDKGEAVDIDHRIKTTATTHLLTNGTWVVERPVEWQHQKTELA